MIDKLDLRLKIEDDRTIVNDCIINSLSFIYI